MSEGEHEDDYKFLDGGMMIHTSCMNGDDAEDQKSGTQFKFEIGRHWGRPPADGSGK